MYTTYAFNTYGTLGLRTVGNVARDGRCDDNTTLTLLEHVLGGSLDTVKYAIDVDIHGLLPVIQIVFLRLGMSKQPTPYTHAQTKCTYLGLTTNADTSISNKDINSTKVLVDLINSFLDCNRINDISLVSLTGNIVVLGDLSGSVMSLLARNKHDGNIGTRFSKSSAHF